MRDGLLYIELQKASCFNVNTLSLMDIWKPQNWVSESFKLKHKAWNIYKTTRHHEDFISYAKCRNIATTAVKYAKSSFETKLAKDIQQNPTLFWKYVRNNTKVRQDVDKLAKEDGTLTSLIMK